MATENAPDTMESLSAMPEASASHPDHESTWLPRVHALAAGYAPKVDEAPAAPKAPKVDPAPWYSKAMAARDPASRNAAIAEGKALYSKADPPSAAPLSVADLPHVSEMRMQLGIEAPSLPPQVQEMWDSEPMQDLERDALHYLGVEENVPKATIQRIVDRYAERLVTGGRAFDPPGYIRPGDVEEWHTWLTSEAGLSKEQSKRLLDGFLWHHGLVHGPQKGK